MTSAPHPRTFLFSSLLSAEEQGVLRHASRWRWISTLGTGTPAPVSHQKHEKWMRNKGNVYTPGCREVMLTFRGSSVHSLNDKVYFRRPGVVMLFDYNESRDLKGAAHKKDFHCLWLHFCSRECLTFNTNSCDANGRYFQKIPPQIKSGDSVRLIMDAWDHCRKNPNDILTMELLKHQIAAVLLEILGSTIVIPRNSRHKQVIESVQNYITSHPGDDLSLHSLSRIAGYSPYFFHRLFLRYTGNTPAEYVNRARLEKAKTLLRQNYTVHAVAESIGFSSLSYFNQFFKKYMHFSPGLWANQYLAKKQAKCSVPNRGGANLG